MAPHAEPKTLTRNLVRNLPLDNFARENPSIESSRSEFTANL